MKRLHVYALSLLFTGLLSIVLTSCDSTEIKPEICKGGKCDFEIQPNAEIFLVEDSLISEFDVVNGNNLVFQYQYVKNDSKRIADDEYTERIFFEINADVTEFLVSNEELVNINAIFYRACFCPAPAFRRITAGTISGIKEKDLTWKIEADLEIETDGSVVNRSFSKTFKTSE